MRAIKFAFFSLFLLFFSCKKTDELPIERIFKGIVKEKYTGKPIANAGVWINDIGGSCGTDFCTSGPKIASAVTGPDGTFTIRVPNGGGYMAECSLPAEIKSNYAYNGYSGTKLDSDFLEINPQPFSFLKFNIRIRNNRHGKIRISPGRLNILDWDQAVWIQGSNIDTTLIWRCFAESDFWWLYELQNTNKDSLAFDVLNFPIGNYRDTFYHSAEIDIATVNMFYHK